MKAKVNTRLVTDYFVYRWRYIIGYSVIGLLLVTLLWFAATTTPGGLSAAEIDSALKSVALDFTTWNPEALIDLPYQALQGFFVHLFGPSSLSIKAASLVIAVLSSAGLFLLLRLWFRHNTAIITSAIVVATSHFLFVAQSGTPSISIIAIAVFALLFSILISRRSRLVLLWQAGLAVTIGLGLYTPFTLYIVLTLISTALIHPHLRFIVKNTPLWGLITFSLITIILASPLIIAIAQEPEVGLALLGVPAESIDWTANITSLYTQLFSVAAPVSSTVMTPLYGLGSWLLIALGVYRLLSARHTARNYAITVWLIIMIPVLVVNPEIVSITFVPFMLLIGHGIDYLIRRWYGLFPSNPYARVAGLLPLGILIVGITYTGVQRYIYGFLYSPEIAQNYSYDLQILDDITKSQRRPITLVTGESERPLYELVAKHDDTVSIGDHNKGQSHLKGLVVYTRAAKRDYGPEATPQQVVTGSFRNQADRFYLYRPDSK